MQDMKAQLEKLLTEASECALIASLATDKKKRDLFSKLSEHYAGLRGKEGDRGSGNRQSVRSDTSARPRRERPSQAALVRRLEPSTFPAVGERAALSPCPVARSRSRLR